jgi:tetratricopeptide (TPR) repeat protein
MKLATRTAHKDGLALGIGLALVFMSPGLICADADNVPESDTVANVATPAPADPVRILNNETLDRLFGHTRQSQTGAPNPAQIIQNDPLASAQTKQDPQLRPPNQTSLVAITRSTSAKRAAAIRLAQQGTSLLRAGAYDKAVSMLEKALSLEASPYVYFYLAQAHHQLGHYQDALNFLEVAESWLDQEPEWVPEIIALKARIPGSGVVQQLTSTPIELAANR